MATAIQVQPSTYPGVVVQNEQPPNNLKCMKGLAITQLVIGILSLIIGIAVAASLVSANHWVLNVGSGIWAGVWIGVTGILGIMYTLKWKSGVLSGFYLAFSILSTILAFLTGIFYIVVSLWYSLTVGCLSDVNGRIIYSQNNCSYRNVGYGLHVFLVLLMIVEFIISIIASCCSCQAGCCKNNSNRQAGVVLQPMVLPQQPQPYVVVQHPHDKQGYPAGYTGQPEPAPAYNAQPYPGV